MNAILGKRDFAYQTKQSRTKALLKQNGYLLLSAASIALSACFDNVEQQLLVLSIVAGAKWIVESKSLRTNIVIVERR